MTNGITKKLLKYFVPGFVPRWEAYNNLILKNLNDSTVWIDGGCGSNSFVEKYSPNVKDASGVDIYKHPEIKGNFILSGLDNLPFENETVDLITLRFVVEHLDNIESYFREFQRVLKKGGKIIILTTNLYCPYIFIASLIPDKIKNPLLSKIFKVNSYDIFSTYHHLNTPAKYFEFDKEFQVDKMQFISDLNTENLPVFLIFLLWHILTKPLIFNKFRTNILAVLEKL